MATSTRRRLAGGVLGALIMLVVSSATATAALAAGPKEVVVQQGNAVASAGQLVLEPTERGYRGSMSVTLRNTGTEVGYFRLLVREPVAGSFDNAEPDQFCQRETSYAGHRSTYGCFLNGIQPGAELTFQLRFRVLTTTQEYAMRATGGGIAISGDYQWDEPFSEFADYTALFRSTTGAVRGPRPYKQDLLAESSIAIAGDLTLTRGANGWFTGRLTATVRYGTDAAHNWLYLETEAPGDVILMGTDPAEVPCWRTCEAPGGAFMEGEQRTFDLLFEAPPETELGLLGQGTAKVSARWLGATVDEIDGSNNAVTFQVRTVEAA